MAKQHGGRRKGAGRKPKDEEQKIIERLDKHIDKDKPFKILEKLITEENFNALKLYMEYRFGKPKETIENSHSFSKPPKKTFEDFGSDQ